MFCKQANLAHTKQLSKLRSAREKATKLLDGKTEIMVMEEMKVKPRSTFVLNRGAYNQPNDKIREDDPVTNEIISSMPT